MSSPESWITEIRARLAAPAPAELGKGRGGKRAAVLVPLYVDAGELWTVLTRRTEDLPTHKNQIAFPGGRAEQGESPWETAVREAQEEVGFVPQTVVRLGSLDELETPSGFRIVPCVGAVPAGFVTRIQEAEIAEVFRVPLTALANPQLIEDRAVKIDGQERMLRVYHVGSRQIWGLTARIIQTLLERLGLAPPPESIH